MKQKKKILSKFKRCVTIDGGEWTYRVTGKTIHICNPERTEKWTFFTDQLEEHDCDGEECFICEMDWRDSHRPIKPSDVIKVVLDKILGLISVWPESEGTPEKPIRI